MAIISSASFQKINLQINTSNTTKSNISAGALLNQSIVQYADVNRISLCYKKILAECENKWQASEHFIERPTHIIVHLWDGQPDIVKEA